MVVNSTTLEMRSMWHTDQKTLDWSILSLKELETRVQHHNFRKSTWKTTPFFLEATFIIKCPRTWKCSCQLVMLLRFCQRCAKKKLPTKIIFGGLLTLIFSSEIYNKNKAYSIFSQVSESGLIKLSRFLLFRLSFLYIMYQFTAPI